MDDPVRPLLAYDERLQRVREIPCHKVYHLNLVFVLRALGSDATPCVEHARVILDKGGIRRLEWNGSASLRTSFPAAEPPAPAQLPAAIADVEGRLALDGAPPSAVLPRSN